MMKELLIIISLCLEWLLISIIVTSYNKDIKPLYGIIPALILAIILTIPQDILIKLNSIFIISLILITMLKSNINIRRVHLFFLIFFFFVLEFSKISFSIKFLCQSKRMFGKVLSKFSPYHNSINFFLI